MEDAAESAGRGKRYAAFISYSHADEEFGDWLHKHLEGYAVPAPLVGQTGSHGLIGKRIGKVFRDRADLSAAHDLGAEIRAGLEAADALIILCSPRACGSKYVKDEIRIFKALGKGERILAAIVAGEPHAAGKPNATAADECFPRALLYRVDDAGVLTEIPEANEPIAADFRKEKDGRENGALKLIAGLLGVPLDELVQRERQAERGRRRRAMMLAAAMSVLAIAAAAAGGFAFVQGNEAMRQRDIAREGLASALAQRALDAREAGDVSLSVRSALLGLNAFPDRAEEFLPILRWHAHETRGGITLAAPNTTVTGAVFAPNQQEVLIGSRDGAVRLVSISERRVLRTFTHNESAIESVAISPDGQVIAAGSAGAITLWRRDGERLRGWSSEAASIAFSPDGSRLGVAGWTVGHEYEVATGSELSRLDMIIDDNPPGHVAYVSGGVLFAFAAQIRALWSDGTQSEVATLGDFCAGLAQARDRDLVATSCEDMPLAFFSTSNRRASSLAEAAQPSAMGLNATPSATAISPDGATIAVGTEEGYVVSPTALSRSRSYVAARTLGRHAGTVTAVTFDATGTQILTAGADGTARLWRLDDPEVLSAWPAPQTYVEQFASGGRYPDVRGEFPSRDAIDALVERDGVRILELPGMAPLAISVAGAIETLRVTPSRSHAVIATDRDQVQVWDLRRRELVLALTDGGSDADISPDGAILVIVRSPFTIFWDVNSGRRLGSFEGDDGAIVDAEFSASGDLLRLVLAYSDTANFYMDTSALLLSREDAVRHACERTLPTDGQNFTDAELALDATLRAVSEMAPNQPLCPQ
jgi:WD40 repeat protein